MARSAARSLCWYSRTSIMLDLGDGWIWGAGALLPLFFLPRRKALSRFARKRRESIHSQTLSETARKAAASRRTPRRRRAKARPLQEGLAGEPRGGGAE